ncbi:PREDICTED: CASP-like protein 4A3 [Nelumbo nucifera]|uniref:CASP-like protein n=2 Tax=Nelumbo nucifera TaxID=4432 RepID=A0A822YI41_NELNU|nr:PREDICTED: CASP-like protein 4A3 [Nelumbo nucifera]DAD30949.1 TPA_asm: hypothetical protein HUJ06_009800 [Nelumbo nucifera]
MEDDSSPLRSPGEDKYISPPESPPDHDDIPPDNSLSKAIVPVDFYSRGSSPIEDKKPVPLPHDEPRNIPSPVVVVNRSTREELPVVTKVDPGGRDGLAGRGAGGDATEDGHGGERRSKAVLSILRRSRREVMVKRAALGFRICAAVFCLVSFSVMASDKTQGWSGDSFYRYKEYRYCVSVSVIAFVYAGFQAYALSYHLITGKYVIRHALRCLLDFSIDQILTYLLISASSSAATRVDDWVSNWGKDEFTKMASASIAMSFLAFVAFAFSSLISGYHLCTRYSYT